MKLGPLAKLDKRKKTASKHFEDDVMSINGDVIVILTIYGQLGAIRKLDSGPLVCKLTFLLKVTLYLTKTENSTKKPPTQLSHYRFE